MPPGYLAVFSVDTEEEARKLLVLACPRNLAGDFVAAELATEQNMDNLFAFSDRLKECHTKMLANRKEAAHARDEVRPPGH